MKNRAGVALVDALVAIGICAAAFVPVMSLFETSTRRTACNLRRVAAQMVATSVTERYRLASWKELTSLATAEGGARAVGADPILAELQSLTTDAAPYRKLIVKARFEALIGLSGGLLTVRVEDDGAPDLVTVTLIRDGRFFHGVD